MKKEPRRVLLRLSLETLRTLSDPDARLAVGGAINSTNLLCAGTRWCTGKVMPPGGGSESCACDRDEVVLGGRG